MSRYTLLLLLASPIAAAAESPADSFNRKPTTDQVRFFETKVRPLLSEHCYSCHSEKAKRLEAGLRLDGLAHVAQGGDSGPAIVPGKPKESLLIQAVRWQSYEMPPRGKLSEEQIQVLAKWVEMGAPWPNDQPAAASKEGEPYDWEKFRREHWSFQPVRKPQPPPAEDSAWPQSDLDRFVWARLREAGLKPNPPADKQTLLRRASLGLSGLPPTPQEIQAFLDDDSPQAFARVVDRLLKSPHYGERWARHWLDVARYSDGLGGFLDNAALPNAWRYRDWVVQVLNDDLPYNDFLRAQIAGDCIEGVDPLGTGFFAVGPTYRSDGGDPEAVAQAKAETLADRVDTFSRAFLGLTAACARCHHHKFDPIAIEDYYSLAGIFNNTRLGEHPMATPAEVQAWKDGQDAIRKQNDAINKFLNEASKRLNEKNRKKVEQMLNEEEKKQLAEMREELKRRQKAAPPKYPTAHVLAEAGSRDMHVAIRGDLRKRGDPAPRQFLRILTSADAPRFSQGSGRKELAEAVVDPANPLTARVIVNRVWQWHFGKGLVRTPSNFGVLGEKPTHPQLLDWLTADFVENGWSLKRLHRQILLSQTWRMSSRHRADAFPKDGDNRLLWRMNLRKLEVEAWRDSLLAATGELDRTLGGAPSNQILNSRRRTLYTTISRNGDRFESDEFLRLFDFPAPRVSSDKRSSSVTPQQYLFMMNSPFMTARAKALAADLQKSHSEDRQRIEAAYLRLYSRPAQEAELQVGLAFLGEEPEQRWPRYAQVLLCAHEFFQIP